MVAGAGSGKTFTIMGKVKYLIEKEGYKEDEILCISFTNETVKNLYEKLLELGYEIEVKTFHKLGLKFLEGENYTIVEDSYLGYIIDEYVRSFIQYDKKRVRLFKNILYTEKSFSNLLKSQEYKNLKKTMMNFIKLAKSNHFTIRDIYDVYKRSWFNEKSLLKNILDVYMIYERELESSLKIDFDDMITKAIENVRITDMRYKYIIIDEFQDTSMIRYELIQEIVKYTNSRVFVVGDDWQSIYRFSGCNLKLFLHFNQYFKESKYFYLKYTYRNSNELIHVSSQFIMQNRKQLKKSILSQKNLTKPIVILFSYTVSEILSLIQGEEILILGRNNADIASVDWENKLTIHRSKGLEEKNVILVNSDSIPNVMQQERIMRHVLKDNDYILYEEERRLFYVALTRTKERIFIQVNRKISPFVKELMRDYRQYVTVLKK